MSIVPYNSNNEIVFYNTNEGVLVVHNNQQNTIQLLSTEIHAKDESGVTIGSQRYANSSSTPNDGNECPNCGYLWSKRRNSHDLQTNSIKVAKVDPYEFNKVYQSMPQGFMHHEYFKLLEKLPHKTSSSSPKIELNSLPKDIFNQGYFKKFFKKVPPYELGSGAHAYVYKVVHVLNDIDLGTYAVKRISVGGKFELLDQVLNEVLILYELSVKGANENNLIRYNHVWLEMGDLNDLSAYFVGDNLRLSSNSKIPYVFILQQYCDGGHLEDMIMQNFQREKLLTEKEKVQLERLRRRSKRSNSILTENKRNWLNEIEIWKFFKDIATGVNYLHVHGILHRDLKPSNCLLEDKYENIPINNGPFNTNQEFMDEISKLPKVLLSDFGEGLFIDKHSLPEPNDYIKNKYTSDYERCGNTGTLEFTAPELWIYSDPLGSDSKSFMNRFTYESDIYSLGLILCFLCVGQLPFSKSLENDPDPQSIREKIIKWYDGLTAQTFHEWFVDVASEKGILCNDNSCYHDFEYLIYSMLKGNESGNSINRASSAHILLALDSIKQTRFFVEPDLEQNSRRSSITVLSNELNVPLMEVDEPIANLRLNITDSNRILVPQLSTTIKLYLLNLFTLESICYFSEKNLLVTKLITIFTLALDILQLVPKTYKLSLYLSTTVVSIALLAFN